MKFIKKSMVALIITAVICISLPFSVLADIDDKKRVTPVPPDIITTPKEKIPVEHVKKPISKWWYAAGAVLLLIPALGGGGGGGGGGGDTSSDETGSIVINGDAP